MQSPGSSRQYKFCLAQYKEVYRMKTKRYEIDMTQGSLPINILRFALPFMAAGIIQLLFNAADVVVVGKFVGDASQAAVTSTGSLVNLLIGLFMGLGVGVNVMVARSLGRGDQSQISAVVHTSILIGIIAGCALTALGEVGARWFLLLMGSPDNVIDLSALYLRVYFIGLPGALVYNFGSALLRARGDTKRPMYFLTFAGVVNVVLNLIFVIVFHWDVAGVAAATAISKYVSAILVVWCLMNETGPLHLDLTRLRVDWTVLKDIARIGLPAGLQGSMFSLSNVTIQSSINSMGGIVMAGSGAATNIGGFVYTTGNAFYQAAMTFTSQNYGAGKLKRVDRVFGWCQLFGILFPLASGVFSCVFASQLLGLYSNDPAVIQQGITRLFIITLFYFLCGFLEVNSGMLRGLGHSMLPMVVTLIGTCGFRIVWVTTVFDHFLTPQSLYLCYPVTWFVTGVALLVCFVIIRHRLRAKAGHDEALTRS